LLETEILGMKGILLLLFLFSVLTMRAQEITVRSFKADNVDFREYRTYFWAAQVDKQPDDDGYFLGDLFLKADIRDAVHEELESRGYNLDERNPDLLVNFRVFSTATSLRGLEGYGTSYWNKREIFSIHSGADEIKVEAGTLIISLLDKRDSRLVWQGLAAGLDDLKNEGKIREAVMNVFQEYSDRTSEYTKR
jgi:hypothetical protein